MRRWKHARSDGQFVGSIWECACGDGAISKILFDRNMPVVSTDLVDRGYGTPKVDFLMEQKSLGDNIITNPPYKMANEFVLHALSLKISKAAFLMRLGCLAGQERHSLFLLHPPARVWVISNRMNMWRNGAKPDRAVSNGMFDYAWFVWMAGFRGHTKLGWINTKGLDNG